VSTDPDIHRLRSSHEYFTLERVMTPIEEILWYIIVWTTIVTSAGVFIIRVILCLHDFRCLDELRRRNVDEYDDEDD
jgi:hypothetical protein